MKKFFTMAAIALFALVSCSEDDAAPTNPGTGQTEAALIKKIQWDDPILGTVTTIFNYTGNKLSSEIKPATPGGSYYTYSDSLITKIELKDGDSNLIKRETFEYDLNNKLAVYTIHWPDLESTGESTIKNIYIYNSDGTISINEYNGNETSQTNYLSTTLLTISEGNIVNSEYNGFFGSLSKSYVFDNNNSPFKNVTGYNAVILARMEGGINNIIEKNASADSSSSGFTYNNLGYPLTEQRDDVGNVYDIQYFYE